MVEEEKKENKPKKEEPKFNKQSLLGSKKYTSLKDALNVVLDDGKEYTIKEVEGKINTFMKGENK